MKEETLRRDKSVLHEDSDICLFMIKNIVGGAAIEMRLTSKRKPTTIT
jgi:hypothetical protein